MAARTQTDLVREEQIKRPSSITEDLRIPGVDSLHTKEKSEIAGVLTNVLKSRAGITRLVWNVGHSIELTYEV